MSLPVVQFVEKTAEGKAMTVAQSMAPHDFDFIIGCDTVITLDGRIIGKPKNLEDARATLQKSNLTDSLPNLVGPKAFSPVKTIYLTANNSAISRLSGRVHEVYSGVALVDSNMKCEVFHEKTEVKFSVIPDQVLDDYIKAGESLGRAGSYGIQGQAALFVEKINGCYYNVVGLPINKIFQKLVGKVQFFRNN
ncbi:unnamed protein product [Enterobius vermicularis]|uniref:Septum formation protein Maf n=1 Tax=Enterobius vermicularis TaxID=51028 RepID=A0A0N4V4Q1_ENTVE|nr:unnamed protein product [Enterobius vermicularis]